MRISVISAAVCCALFPLISVSAAGLSVEQRLAQLEARLNLAEQQASEASRRAQRAEQQTAAAEQRRGGGAAGAGAQPADHGSRTKQQATNQQLSEQLAKRVPDDGFTFNAYARSGMLVNSHGKGARGGRASPRPVRSTAMPMSVVSVTKR